MNLLIQNCWSSVCQTYKKNTKREKTNGNGGPSLNDSKLSQNKSFYALPRTLGGFLQVRAPWPLEHCLAHNYSYMWQQYDDGGGGGIGEVDDHWDNDDDHDHGCEDIDDDDM